MHSTDACSPGTLEEASAPAAAAGTAPGGPHVATGASASPPETLPGSSGLSTSQDHSPGHHLLAGDPEKAASSRPLVGGDSPAGGGSEEVLAQCRYKIGAASQGMERAGSSEVLAQCRFKVGTPSQGMERAGITGRAISGDDSRGSGTGSSSESRSRLVSESLSGPSGLSSMTGPGLGAAALHALRNGSQGPCEGRGAQPGLPRPADDPGAACQASAQDGSQVCTEHCATHGRLQVCAKAVRQCVLRGPGPQHICC